MPLLAFVVLFLELTLLILFGQRLGFSLLFAEVLLSGVAGYSLMRSAGRTAFQPAQLIGLFLHGARPGLASRQPAEWLLLGCLLLIVPGILTDLLGLVFITRFFMRSRTQPQSSAGSDSIDVKFDVHDDSDS